jgi:recombination associated protein RdgC
MKQIIKAAIVYQADFGVNAATLNEKLAEHTFKECEPNQIRSIGFVPVSEGDALTAEFKNGFAFRVRIDQKQIPGAVLQAKTDELSEGFQQLELRKPSKTERETLKDEALYVLATQAFPRTAIITCFYQQTTGYLIVPTTSKHLAGCITSALVQATGSVKTETIHVSDVKHGLTTRLNEWINGDAEAFGVFEPCAEAALQQGDRKISIKMGSLEGTNLAIKEALAAKFNVMSMGFTHDGQTEFRLTKEFRLKGIEFAHTDNEDDEAPSFYAQATLEVDAVSAVITDLVEMIGHGEEEGSDEPQEAANADA